jgi:hypothetical protein
MLNKELKTKINDDIEEKLYNVCPQDTDNEVYDDIKCEMNNLTSYMTAEESEDRWEWDIMIGDVLVCTVIPQVLQITEDEDGDVEDGWGYLNDWTIRWYNCSEYECEIIDSIIMMDMLVNN